MPSKGIARLVGLIVLLSACTSDKEKSDGVTISGRVFVAGKATALPNVEVVLPDGSRTKSGEQGAFSAQSKSGKSVTVETAGYAPVSKPAPQGTGYLELYAKPTDAKKTLQGSQGGEVTSDKGGKVNVPAGAFTSKAGKVPTEAAVELALPDPRKSTDLPSLPGDFDARKGGKAGKVSTESPLYLSAKDAGKSLEVADGKEIEASFPARRAGGPSNATLFYFNNETQEWEARGEAPRSKNKALDATYDVKLDALGWWAVGEFYDRLSCVRACVVDADGKAAPFARAVATGIDHFTQLSAYAGDDGCFALAVRTSAQVSLTVQTRTGFVPARVVTTASEAIDVAEDPGDCQDLGELKLEPQKVKDCPLGLEKCDGACVDVLNDAANCGACGDRCGGTEGREQSCIAGECNCPRGFTTCRADAELVHCALEESDVENCGGCSIACAEGEVCSAGRCSGEGETTPDGGMDAGSSDGSVPAESCFPDGIATAACQECATSSCCSTCTGGCPALVACAYTRCTNPRECPVAQLCPDEADTESLAAFQTFVSCTNETCGSLCEVKPDAGMPDGGPGQRMCQVVQVSPTGCTAQSEVCLGVSFRVQCTLGASTTVYDWRVGTPSNDACSVGCYVNNAAVAGTCAYGTNLCEDPQIATVPCDPECSFPLDVPRPPKFEPPPPHVPVDAGPVDPQTTPGNDSAGTVSCGGDATAETPCTLSGGDTCCIGADGVSASCSATVCPITRQALCDGPEDCSAGQTCCITDDELNTSEPVRTQCLGQCPPSTPDVIVSTACHQTSHCPGGTICVRDPLSVRQYWGTCVAQ
jgi:hypothetical protein